MDQKFLSLCISSDYSLITYLHIFVFELAASSEVSILFEAIMQKRNLVYQFLILSKLRDSGSTVFAWYFLACTGLRKLVFILGNS